MILYWFWLGMLLFINVAAAVMNPGLLALTVPTLAAALLLRPEDVG